MGAHPYYKRFPSDALNGKRGLSLELRGAYDTILDLLYDDGGEALPSSERWMAGQLDVSPRKWRSLRDDLVAAGKIIVLDDGRITNDRYLRERAKRSDVSEKRATAGAKGGSAPRSRDLFDASSTPENVASSAEFASFSTPENVLSGKDNSDERDAKPAENSHSSQANASVLPLYAGATRDRESRVQSLEEEERRIESQSAGRTRNPDDRPNGIEDLEREGLLTITQQLARVGGIALRPERPGSFTRELNQAKAWITDGIDIDRTVVPAIAKQLARMTDTAGSLKVFDSAVRNAHAKTLTANGEPAGPSKFDDAEAQRAYLAKLQK